MFHVVIEQTPSDCDDPRAGQLFAYSIKTDGSVLENESHGMVHLYRDGNALSGQSILCILSVPSYTTPSDLLGFIGKEFCDKTSHIRMLRTKVPNRYMVLLKFRSDLFASEFYEAYNGTTFNSMDSERCQVVKVGSITKKVLSESKPFIDDLDDPFSVTGSGVLVSKPPAPPTGPLKELPTCVVCLERMDASVTGLLTILCQHSFHCSCLRKWSDASCPICRYSQKRDVSEQPQKCVSCDCSTSLWACLICGNVGCGRYDEGHAIAHFNSTDHCFAISLDTQRVWDYSQDIYVHRLIQNEADGKLVELPGNADESADKLNDLGLEYARVLSSQLESQRIYFQEMLDAAADKARLATEEALTNVIEMNALKDKNEELKSRYSLMENEVKSMRTTKNTLDQLCQRLRNDWKDESAMNKSLMQRIEHLNSKMQEMQGTIDSQQDELKDVYFYLQVQEKVKGTDTEGASTMKIV